MSKTVCAREAYLNNEWSRYPTKPKSHNFAGRVAFCGCIQGNAILELRIAASELIRFQLNSESWLERLLPGDWVSIQSQNSVVSEICLLAPFLGVSAYRPGHHDVSGEQVLTLKRWSQFLGYVREFFISENFLEVQTPTLVVCPGTEPYLDVFSTEFQQGRRQDKLFLPTSPELHLKKALARGIPKLFEIRPCFRNGEVSATHQPEFWMLEWYRSFEELPTIKQDVENLVHFLIDKMQVSVNFSQPKSLSLAELFRLRCDFELKPNTGSSELLGLCHRLKIDVGSSTSFDDLFFFLFLEKIELTLLPEGPLFVEKYPPSQAALARLTNDGWGDRFEFYWQGLEIANAFHELNDPVIQSQRFAQDLVKKMDLKKTEVPIDQEFIDCLDMGLPPAAGIALGLERLFMALTCDQNQHHDIGRLRLFPIA